MDEKQIRQILKEISCKDEVEEAILVLYGYSHLYDIHRVTNSCSTKTKEVVLESIEHLGYSDLFSEKDKDVLYKIIQCYARTPMHRRNGRFFGKLDMIRDWTLDSKREILEEDLYNLMILINDDYDDYNESNKVANQLSEIFGRELLEVEKEVVKTVRTRQHIFRRKVLVLNNYRCQICGIGNGDFLVASHSKDWSKSNHFEKTYEYNGLCLCVQHDFLYDRGYISFNDDGTIIISPFLDSDIMERYNINSNIKIKIMEEHKKYLNWHRENKFRK